MVDRYRPGVVNVLAGVRPGSVTGAEAVAYEVALEGASQVIGFYAGLIAGQEDAAEPDTEAMARWRAEQRAWAVRRRELTPTDAREIAAIHIAGEDLLADPSDEDDEQEGPSTAHRAAAAQAADARRTQVLEETESERIFRDRIAPVELTGTSQIQPVVVIVAGQPGDGKAAITALAQDVLNSRGRSVTISPDRYEPHHPSFHALMAEEPLLVGRADEDAMRWTTRAAAYARSQRFNVVIESVLRDPGAFADQARQFKAAGYQVEVALVAVHEAASRFGVLDRHLRALEVFGYGRLAETEVHDACYQAVLRGAEVVDREEIADRVAVLRPDGRLIYGNQRIAGGGWQQPPSTAEAINWERRRPWTVAESRLFLDAVLEFQQIGLSAPIPWIRSEAIEGARTVNALAAPRLHPDAVTLHIATAGVSRPDA